MSSHYYNTCPICGANLDPGETCDCEFLPQTTLTRITSAIDDEVAGDPRLPAKIDHLGIHNRCYDKQLLEAQRVLNSDDNKNRYFTPFTFDLDATTQPLQQVQKSMFKSDSLMISWNSASGEDIAVVTVGRVINGRLDYINQLSGEQAERVYRDLLGSNFISKMPHILQIQI